MSDKPRDITLERVNRLTQAVADLGENQTAQGRMLLRMLGQMNEHLSAISGQLTSLAGTMREMASEQILLGDRVETAFSRALRTNIRLDEIEDGKKGAP
jgi:hypothetical protein